mgnify:CR=1 FL=1
MNSNIRIHIVLGCMIVLYSVAIIGIMPTVSAFYDAAQVFYLAKYFSSSGTFPAYGIINSQMLYNPPFFVWYYYIPAIFTSDPGLLTIVPALPAQIVTMVLLYLIGRDYFRPIMGLVVATLYAFTPLGMVLGRIGWAHAFVAPLYVAIVFCLFRWLISRQNIYIIPLIVLCGWITGVHLAGALTFVVVAASAFVSRTLPSPRLLIIGLGLLVLLYTPFLIFQYSRGFADIIGLVQPPANPISPTELSPLCPPDWNATLPSATLAEGVTVGNFGTSMVRAIYNNYYFRTPWSVYEHIIVFTFVPLFGLACMRLIYHIVRRRATPAEYLLLLVFGIPLILQNLTSFNTIARPDITWMLFGVQMLIIGYGITVPTYMQARPMQIAVIVALSLMIGYQSYQAGQTLGAWGRGDLYDGRQEIADAIAADAAPRGLQAVAIRYDFLRDDPSVCWIVGMSTIIDTGYIGTEFDYYLHFMHKLPNLAQTPDGWVEDPDYIVTRAASPRAAYYAKYPERYVSLQARPPYQVWYHQR